MNGDHFPFVFRKYKTVLFVDKVDGRMAEVEVDGAFEPYPGVDAENYCNWGFKFRFGKIIKRKRKGSK